RPAEDLARPGGGRGGLTGDPDLAERLRRLRQYGQTDRYQHASEGVNSRLDELQAAVLRVRLPHLTRWNARRAEIAAVYTEALAGTAARPLKRLDGRRHAFHLFVIETNDREALRTHLDAAGVKTLVHYPTPIHEHPPYRHLGHGPVPLAVSEGLC